MPPEVTHAASSRPRGLDPLALIASVLVAAAIFAIAWGSGGPLHVTVDGVGRTVQPRTTVGDLATAHYAIARAGSMLSVSGGIIRVGAGDPASFKRDGLAVSSAQRVYEGDVITSRSGGNRNESTASNRVSIDPTATIQGSGSILQVVRPGRSGVSLVTVGAISRSIVSTKILVPAENIVLQASAPTSADKIVALTFDDGPWLVQTEKILAILKTAGVHATFFELGQQVQRHPEISRAVVAADSVIGDHSWNHPLLTRMLPPQVRRQIADTAAAIKSATGTTPTQFRPPYGAINHTVWSQAKGANQNVVLWDVDTLDWSRPGVPKILANMRSEIGRASIILMHDGGGDRSQTIAALPPMIDWLKQNGYTFVTVEELRAAR